ncbi:hypothetical protein [Altericroceibacterium spongiae]|uniref:hypothetical protein n=1 Tax=Altericroceibacterium spongiae TaxID=2320269 RepID=UPI001602FE32|nr:hypothetical protein [Altericroceibacterium spongiae]
MTKKDLKNADMPEGSNPSQNSQTANAVRNQSIVTPSDYPEEERKKTVAPKKRPNA